MLGIFYPVLISASNAELFDKLNDLTVGKRKWNPEDEEYNKSYDVFMTNRWLSMVDIYLPVINELNKFDNIPKSAHYRYLYHTLPKRKHYFNYIKKVKDFTKEEKELLCEYFECSTKDAERYIQTMSEEEIKQVIGVYKHRKRK